MAEFLHGIEVLYRQSRPEPRPIRTLRSNVIGLVGTAVRGPINTPVLIRNRVDAVTMFGNDFGTIPAALDGIYDQGGASVVVINVFDPAAHKVAIAAASHTAVAGVVTIDSPAYPIREVVVTSDPAGTDYALDTDYTLDSDTGTITRIATSASTFAVDADLLIAYAYPNEADPALVAAVVGGVDVNTGAYQGLHALLAAQGSLKVRPKIVCVPGYSHEVAVIAELPGVLDRLLGTAVVSGPNTTDAAAITLRDTIGSRRMYLVDPHAQVYDTEAAAVVDEDATARIAGVIAVNDSERSGPWHSPSNREINGLVGTARPIDFGIGDPNSRANRLNEQEIATIIQLEGYRLWGNRTCNSAANDPKWNFLNVVRTADAIAESIVEAHLWAVDRCISKEYAAAVIGSVQAYLDTLASPARPGGQAILGGAVWIDPAANPPTELEQGHISFAYDFTPCYPAERVTFSAVLTNNYLEGIF